MKLWFIGDKQVIQLYNNNPLFIKPNSIVEYADDLAVFLLSKKELRGEGLVQLKENDKKEDRYKEARYNQYAWAQEKWADYEKHCEERKEAQKAPYQPHKEILKFKQIIENYEKWEASGFPVIDELKAEMQETKNEQKVFVCPYCSKEFSERVAYFGHMRSHNKEELSVNSGSIANKSKGESG